MEIMEFFVEFIDGNIWKSYGNHGVFVEFIDGNIWKSYGNHGVFVEFIASIEIAIHIYKP
jgi:hypothetical protein